MAGFFILSVLFITARAQGNSYNKAEGRPDLLSFSTVLNNYRIDLKWSTAHEKNLSHFIIQRSTDAINYKDIGIVFSVNKKEGEQSYIFRDEATTIKGDIAYYRLIFMQDDGKFFSSDIKTVQLTGDK
jgi:hypothetical protein